MNVSTPEKSLASEAYQKRIEGFALPEETRLSLTTIACLDPEKARDLLVSIPNGLTDKERRLAFQKAGIDEIGVPFYLYTKVPRIDEEELALLRKANQAHWRGTPETLDALNAIVPVWFVREPWPLYGLNQAFRREKGVPLFVNRKWDLIDSGTDGALIVCDFRNRNRNNRAVRGNVNVILLPDVSLKNEGYAVRVPPRVKTVNQARAWMYQQPIETFQGFTVEV